MVMVHDRRRFVDQGVALLDDVEEGGQVVPAPPPAAGAQRGVEASQPAQHVGPEGHVGAGSQTTRGVREQRVVRPGAVQVEGAGRESLAETAVRLDHRLAWGLELGRPDQSRDAADLIGRELRSQAPDPVAVDHDVVVGEGDHRRGHVLESTVVGACQARHVLSQVGHRRVVAVQHVPGRRGARGVVHDDDLEVWVLRRQQESRQRWSSRGRLWVAITTDTRVSGVARGGHRSNPRGPCIAKPARIRAWARGLMRPPSRGTSAVPTGRPSRRTRTRARR